MISGCSEIQVSLFPRSKLPMFGFVCSGLSATTDETDDALQPQEKSQKS
jgi:hypothetical protein